MSLVVVCAILLIIFVMVGEETLAGLALLMLIVFAYGSGAS